MIFNIVIYLISETTKLLSKLKIARHTLCMYTYTRSLKYDEKHGRKDNARRERRNACKSRRFKQMRIVRICAC